MNLTKEARSVTHSTFVIERVYPVSPERLFAALADPAKKQRWYVGCRGRGVDRFEMDFRAGGREHLSYRLAEGPFQGSQIINDATYLDIVTNRRVVIADSMTLAGKRISSSLNTFEIMPHEKGAALIFTEQGAFFEGADGPEMREGGWRRLLEHLAQELAEERA